MKSVFTRKVAPAVLLLSCLTIVASASYRQLCQGFVPKNDMSIPVGASVQWPRNLPMAGITEAEFNAVIDRAERLFRDDIAKAGGKLVVNRRWTDGTVNAYAEQKGSEWHVSMFGGLARHPATTIEGFSLVICHELGHHIGGAPKISDWWGGSMWATNEGGADYYATLKCLRRFFAEDDNAQIIANSQIDPLANERCDREFTAEQDRLFCKRSSLAGTSVGLLFKDLRKEKNAPSFATPDTAVVTTMDDNHPGTQCRLDTYFNGASCHVDASIPVSNSDYREGSCVQGGTEVGFRPLCWFKP